MNDIEWYRNSISVRKKYKKLDKTPRGIDQHKETKRTCCCATSDEHIVG